MSNIKIIKPTNEFRWSPSQESEGGFVFVIQGQHKIYILQQKWKIIDNTDVIYEWREIPRNFRRFPDREG